ncbi:MAG: alpha/beta fold hydrolase [Burkholderiales bacterium]
MQAAELYCREAGSGPGVVCIHANAGTSGQWRALMDRLAPQYHVLAPDSYGSGKSPPWSAPRMMRLQDEVDLLEPVFAKAGTPLALVGHSYGAAVALMTALTHPGRVRALALYEPTLFAVIDAESPPPNAADGIRDTARRAGAMLDAGKLEKAAGIFIDYWMHPGAWQQMPASRRPAIAASAANLPHWAHALFSETTPLAAFRTLDIPVLYMTGRRSTPAAHGVARLLTGVLPRVEVVEFENLGHMGPVTDPETVNPVIARFLESAYRQTPQ